jgi:ribosomal protein L35
MAAAMMVRNVPRWGRMGVVSCSGRMTAVSSPLSLSSLTSLSSLSTLSAVRMAAPRWVSLSRNLVPAVSSFPVAASVKQVPFRGQLVISSGFKTKSCAKKRFIRTGTGHFKHGRPGKSHLTGQKSRTRTMKLNQKAYVTGRMVNNIRRLING